MLPAAASSRVSWDLAPTPPRTAFTRNQQQQRRQTSDDIVHLLLSVCLRVDLPYLNPAFPILVRILSLSLPLYLNPAWASRKRFDAAAHLVR
ncbi:hypothetical protein QC761_0080290 [Podospora bellae-mahoneyi]|uniref:Uncharacterized protein n=1 Tax=Podospora bellae-mahoneyi TaxID=2093777 RepID=A0ABR0FDI4_9PEZI|nr:hypothetical protein QC761_0080290 [Podospora bellae-mahoneyi]